MSWLRKLLGLNSRSKDDDLGETRQDKTLFGKPPLIILAADSGGLTALSSHRFRDSEAACEFVELRNSRLLGGTLYAFWALSGEPRAEWRAGEDDAGESVVLIRDRRRDGIVFPFSFADLPSAWTFARQEITRGVDFGQISIYWAVPVEIVLSDTGKAHVRPATPPPVSSTVSVADAPYPVINSATRIVREESPEESAARPKGHNGGDAGRMPFPVVRYEIEALELNGPTPAGEMQSNEGTPDVAAREGKDVNGGTSLSEPDSSGEMSTNGERADDEGGERDAQPPKGKNGTPNNPESILRWRRLDQHDGPFKGFGSPRGRF